MLKRIVIVIVAAIASVSYAADTPHAAWIKAKCAVCHGDDGAGNTPEGKRRKVPDLRAPAVQKLTDAELYDVIAEGHDKMPSFKTQVSRERAALLVIYIRGIAKK